MATYEITPYDPEDPTLPEHIHDEICRHPDGDGRELEAEGAKQ